MDIKKSLDFWAEKSLFFKLSSGGDYGRVNHYKVINKDFEGVAIIKMEAINPGQKSKKRWEES